MTDVMGVHWALMIGKNVVLVQVIKDVKFAKIPDGFLFGKISLLKVYNKLRSV